MNWEPTLIASCARTPMGGFQGALATVSATDLGAIAVGAAAARACVDPAAIDRIYMGCVLTGGLGQAPARQVALKAGLPPSVQATTINKMCGSGMQAVIQASEALQARTVGIVVAGGMESMTNAPFLLEKHRAGARIGHDAILDSLMFDGLEDAYERGKPMGAFAEEAARDHQLTREEQDAFAIESLSRANAAIRSGAFSSEIAPVTIKTRMGEMRVAQDEQPRNANPEKIPQLKPAFAHDGTITAATSASISDGAAALILTRPEISEQFGLRCEARICACAAHAQPPALFTTAPIPAIRKVLSEAGWAVADVDLFEINEAFAAVAMIAMRQLEIPRDKLNVNGGATALGHPIGASGARIITTLVAALKARGLRRGVAALCIGGGEATAVAIELV